MAATPSIGLAHVTVVPTNFVPATEEGEGLDDEVAPDAPAPSPGRRRRTGPKLKGS